MDVEHFIQRWTAREGGAERANYQMFLSELCDVLGVDRPQPAGADTAHNDYVFERAVRPRASDGATAPKRIDLYKKAAFILEAKQSRLPGAKNAIPSQLSLLPKEDLENLGRRPRGAAWDVMMQNARKQAEGYVFLLDANQPAPPFIITCDVGHCLEIFADFSGTGRAYNQFPDRHGFRIYMDDLRDPEIRKRLATIWTDPQSLDPTKVSARVTSDIAKRLAQVSKTLEASGSNPEDVAHFLMRCLFTMFAEDTDLLPKGSFCKLLEKSVEDPTHFPHRLKALWQQMDKGDEYSLVIEARVRHFNGGLFAETDVFDLGREEIGELLAAAKADWRQVDPAIFGTLLEQALDKDERRKLGAHYTPRSYVQRLVDVTVLEPLRADWEAALTKAQQARDDGHEKQAIAIVREFHHRLCTTRVLDPACGTGNFLYVSLEMMKQLEGEVLQTLTDLGDEQARLAIAGESVDPHQFLGLELNPRAAAIAELVIWIGYLQWHYRNHESHPNEPILRAFNNINFGRRDGYDAVLTWDGYPNLAPASEGDGGARNAYPNARRPEWPDADFIVGNPPFIGSKRLGVYLTHEYIEALRSIEPTVPSSVDYVMYWWNRAAQLVAAGKVRRSGLVSTNTITQYYNSKVLISHFTAKRPVSLVWAVPDHPWVDVEDGARVRVSLGCLQKGKVDGVSAAVIAEAWTDENEAVVELRRECGRVNAKFTVGASVYDTKPLRANSGLCWQGVKLVGDGFRIDSKLKDHLSKNGDSARYLRPYLTGMAVNRRKSKEWVIDFYGLSEREARTSAPELYEHLVEFVKPERILNRDDGFREKWWIFGRPRPDLRDAISGLPHYLVTSEVSKHRFFTRVSDPATLVDGSLVAVAISEPWVAAVLSSKIHIAWTLWAAGTLEDRPRYQNQLSFDPFPFPTPDRSQKRELGELFIELDTIREQVRSEHEDLSLTNIYNLIAKIAAGAELTHAELDAKQRGRVMILKEMHEKIDALTAQAYGWPADLKAEEQVDRLAALNLERVQEEAAGNVQWLRADYQLARFAKSAAAKTRELDLASNVVAFDAAKPTFPTDRYEQPLAIEAMLAAASAPMDAAELARGFKRGGKRIEQRVAQVLTTLVRYGRVTALPDGRFVARRAA